MSARTQSRGAPQRVMSWGLKQADPCSNRATTICWQCTVPQHLHKGSSARMVTVMGPTTGTQPAGKGEGAAKKSAQCGD